MTAQWHCNSFLAFLMILALQGHPCVANYEHTCSLDTKAHGPVGICGRRIPEVLSVVCGSNYNKRDLPPDMTVSEPYSLDHDLRNIILGKREALSYLQKRHTVYGTQGITCECCYNSCDYAELMEYCST